jgi:hypothetical protein
VTLSADRNGHWPDRPARSWREPAHAGSPVVPSAVAGSAADSPAVDPLLIDCDVCSVRGTACADCMVTVLLGGPPYGVALDEAERHAIDTLAAAGLIPPLRMVQSVDARLPDEDGGA